MKGLAEKSFTVWGQWVMLESSDQRKFYRMSVDASVRIRVEGEDQERTAEAKDLSASGVQFVTAEAIPPGSRIRMALMPGKAITPPLYALLEVLRCVSLEEQGESGFSVACSIVRLLDEGEVGDDFS